MNNKISAQSLAVPMVLDKNNEVHVLKHGILHKTR